MTGIQLISSATGYDLAMNVQRDNQGKVVSGLVLGETTHQNQALILTAHKGEFKEHPTLGVGLQDIINDHDMTMWKRLITDELEKDGMRVDKLTLTEDGLHLEAVYKNR